MRFKNKKTNKEIEVRGYTQEFAYSHNSMWEKVEEKTEKSFKDLTVAQIKEKLTELGIEYDDSMKKADLLTLLPQKG